MCATGGQQAQTPNDCERGAMSPSQKISLHQLEAGPFTEQVTGKDRGKIFQLNNDRLTIGRAKDNDIIVPNGSISRCLYSSGCRWV